MTLPDSQLLRDRLSSDQRSILATFHETAASLDVPPLESSKHRDDRTVAPGDIVHFDSLSHTRSVKKWHKEEYADSLQLVVDIRRPAGDRGTIHIHFFNPETHRFTHTTDTYLFRFDWEHVR